MTSAAADFDFCVLSGSERKRLVGLIENAREEDFLRVLRMPRPRTVEDLCALLSVWGRKHIETLALRAEAVTRKRFGCAVQLYAPLYLSNFCNSGCLYCGFSARHKIARRRLSLDEVGRELDAMRASGMENVLLVAGCDPKMLENDFIFEVIRLCHKRMASVSVEIEPMGGDIYARMAESGLDGLVIYQETYNRVCYESLHPCGSKSDFLGRLEKPALGAAAGLRRVGLGALLGLYDWREDTLSLALHLMELTRRYWKVLFTVSFPRFRGEGIDFVPAEQIDDLTFTQLHCAFRLVFPDTPIYLSTREDARMRDGLVRCGVTHLSAGSRTEPGGYVCYPSHDESGPQFEISDARPAAEIETMLRTQGFDPVWKDWEGVLNG